MLDTSFLIKNFTCYGKSSKTSLTLKTFSKHISLDTILQMPNLFARIKNSLLPILLRLCYQDQQSIPNATETQFVQLSRTAKSQDVQT